MLRTVISPSAGNYTSNLHAISASGASDVWAVGEYFNGAVNQTLIERWDGTVWKIVPSPNEGSVNDSNRLRGVVALSPANAWAVGDYDDGSSQRIFRCRACQVAVFSNYTRPELHFVRGGTLDDPSSVAPDVHIYTRSKLPWVTLSDGVPSFEAYYDSKTLWPAAKLDRLRAAFSSAAGDG